MFSNKLVNALAFLFAILVDFLCHNVQAVPTSNIVCPANNPLYARPGLDLMANLHMYPFFNPAYNCDESTCQAPNCRCASYAPPNNIPIEDAPMFITITFDDGITESATLVMRDIFSQTNKASNSCPVRATFYASITAGGQVATSPETTNFLYEINNEIATHTYNHIASPGLEEIENARIFLSEEGGVPSEKIKGFRAPYLDSSASVFEHLEELSFTYDSTIGHFPHRDHGLLIYPYTLDNGFADDCQSQGRCDNNAVHNGLWEIPMNQNRDFNGNILITMDPEPVYDTYMANFLQRYCTNKSPLGIFLHPSYLQKGGNNQELIRFIEDVTSRDDVFFVTSEQLIEYMKYPVSASQYRSQTQCDGNANEGIYERMSLPEGGCVFGAWSFQSGECVCMSGFCRDSYGACTSSSCANDNNNNNDSCVALANGFNIVDAHCAVCIDSSHTGWPCDTGFCDCPSDPSPVDGSWTQWSYSVCSVACGGGTKTSSRTCTNPAPSNGGSGCDGESSRQEQCNIDACPPPINGLWSDWSSFSECSIPCGGGIQSRRRSCTNPPPSNGGVTCFGEALEEQGCNTNDCPISNPSSGCSVKPSYSAYAIYCELNVNNEAGCKGFPAFCTWSDGSSVPVDGSWSQWSYSACSESCNGGIQTKSRICNNPAPSGGGSDCSGSPTEVQSCNTDACAPPVDGSWSNWSDQLSACSKPCGGGVQTKSRTCNNPVPSNGGSECSGSPTEQQSCNTDVCPPPVDGSWSSWSQFSSCDKSCGGGVQTKSRTCNNPSPSNGGNDCTGSSTEQQTCNTDACPTTSASCSVKQGLSGYSVYCELNVNNESGCQAFQAFCNWS